MSNHILKGLILIYLLIGISLAQPDLSDQDVMETKHEKQAGIVLTMAETGSGIGGFMVWPIFKNFHMGPTLDFYFLRDSRQIDIYDYYYNVPYSINKENNVYLLDFLVTAKRRFFRDSLDDSFRPFLTGAVGVIYGMNFPEENPYFKRSDEFALTFGGFFGAGVDICVGDRNLVSVRAQYRVMPFPNRIGETSDHSMFELRFELGQRF
jgi:hypothetical protein